MLKSKIGAQMGAVLSISAMHLYICFGYVLPEVWKSSKQKSEIIKAIYFYFFRLSN